MPESIRITPPPGLLDQLERHRAAKLSAEVDEALAERARRRRIETRADSRQGCVFCDSGLYPEIPDGRCPSCGRATTNGSGLKEST
jgi:hypothetical protein